VLVTIWATLLLLAFLWSVFLFALTVIDRRQQKPGGERRQETGAVYAFAGLCLFVLAFADRLPFSPTNLRDPLAFLPGVDESSLDFESSLVGLLLITAIYIARILVFLQLVPGNDASRMNRDDLLEVLRDILAPLLAFVTLDLCLTVLLAGSYEWNGLIALLAFAVVLALFFFRIGERAAELARSIQGVIVLIAKWLARAFRSLPVAIIEAFVWFESLRPRAADNDAMNRWIANRIEKLDGDPDLSAKQRERLDRAYKRLLAKREKRRKTGKRIEP